MRRLSGWLLRRMRISSPPGSPVLTGGHIELKSAAAYLGRCVTCGSHRKHFSGLCWQPEKRGRQERWGNSFPQRAASFLDRCPRLRRFGESAFSPTRLSSGEQEREVLPGDKEVRLISIPVTDCAGRWGDALWSRQRVALQPRLNTAIRLSARARWWRCRWKRRAINRRTASCPPKPQRRGCWRVSTSASSRSSGGSGGTRSSWSCSHGSRRY